MPVRLFLFILTLLIPITGTADSSITVEKIFRSDHRNLSAFFPRRRQRSGLYANRPRHRGVPRSPAISGQFQLVTNVQRKQVCHILVDGKDIPVIVPYEKIFAGKKNVENSRTQKQLAIKAYLPNREY